MTKRTAAAAPAILLALFSGLFTPGLAIGEESDPAAVAAGRAMIQAMGGREGWERARYFRFDFVVVKEGKKIASFSHSWDRYDGRYRVEGTAPGGASWKAYFNVNTKEGEYFVNDSRAEGAAKKAGLEEAYGRFINDTYWLLAPWKIFDPGVTLHGGQEAKDSEGRSCREIRLSFDNVGLTPKDVYWMDIDEKTHRMTQWKYVLNGGSEPPTVAAWKDWGTYGPIQLSAVKTLEGKPVEIRFENLAVSETPDDSALTPPR
jgi:hypothetical protein